MIDDEQRFPMAVPKCSKKYTEGTTPQEVNVYGQGSGFTKMYNINKITKVSGFVKKFFENLTNLF